MKGLHHITIEDKHIKYEFDISRNITVIRGDSATGKTTLIDMIGQYENAGENSGITVNSDVELATLSGNRWKDKLAYLAKCIIFIDEGNAFMKTEEFSLAVAHADAYFVLVTREKLSNLPYSVDEIYGIRSSGRYAGLSKVYHEFFRIYTDFNASDKEWSRIISEDSNSAYDFWKKIAADRGMAVIPAGGKSNIPGKIAEMPEEQVLVIADGAAFGPEIDNIYSLKKMGYDICLYLPESFEWVLLNADIMDDPEIRDMLEQPYNYADSTEYMNWERFFTRLLVDKTDGTYLKYSKQKLNPTYLKGRVFEKIKSTLPKIFRENR